MLEYIIIYIKYVDHLTTRESRCQCKADECTFIFAGGILKLDLITLNFAIVTFVDFHTLLGTVNDVKDVY